MPATPFGVVIAMLVVVPLQIVSLLARVLGNGLTDRVVLVVNTFTQFGTALVMVIPVIWITCPSLANVKTGVVKLAIPEPFETTPTIEA